MGLLSWWRAVATGLFRRKRLEQEMDDEIRAHIRERAEDLRRAGVAEEQAERRARIEFGGAERFKEECREALVVSWIDHLWRDFRFGLRMSMKSPGFTAAAVIALALKRKAGQSRVDVVWAARGWRETRKGAVGGGGASSEARGTVSGHQQRRDGECAAD